jgi:GTP-binding protein YchF
MRIGLFGFPMTGKSTLFRLLTGAEMPAHGHRGEAVIGVAKVPDARLERLAEIVEPKKVTHATVEYLDMVGMEKGEAAQVLPLDKLKTADALAHVVRAFPDQSIAHVEGDLDAARDVDTMETEFVLTDHTIAQRRVEKLEALVMKTNDENDKKELELLRKCLGGLEQGTPLRNLELSEWEDKLLRGYTFLSRKPLLIVVNAGEEDAERIRDGAAAFGLEEYEKRPGTAVVALSARIEAEIAELEEEDAAAFREDLGITEAALERVIRASYRLLGRMSFFTFVGGECRAWTVPAGCSAQAAAGAVHSDMERGFIRAEVVAFDDLAASGSWAACRDDGTLKIEGKDHVIEDGDVLNIRFNV